MQSAQPTLPAGRKNFPRKTFKGVAGATIALGILCVIIGVSQGIYSVTSQKRCNRWARHLDGDEYFRDYIFPDDYYYEDEEFEIEPSERFDEDMDERHTHHGFWRYFDDEDWSRVSRCKTLRAVGGAMAVLYIGCGMLFIVTGCLGVGAARTVLSHRQSGLKTGYIVMNILNVLSSAPALFVFATAMAVSCSHIVRRQPYWKGHRVNGIIMGVTGLATGILCLVASAISCCCAPIDEDKQAKEVPVQQVQHQVEPAVVPVLMHVNLDDKAQLIDDYATQA